MIGDLPPETLDSYRRDGFVRLRALLDADTLGRYGEEITRLTLALNTQTRPLAERTTYDRAFLQVMNLWRESETVREFVFDRRLAAIAARLMGVDRVRIYHDQSLYKEPSGGITPAHADQYYWPFASDKAITAWIPLQPVPLEMGPLAFYRGSHATDFGRDLPISDESERQIGAAMTIIYIDAAMRISTPVNPMQRDDLSRWLPGLAPGDIAASALNPVVGP